ncbi:MAG TPA: ThiF family adenylyltransferase [Candidatus Saccharimonadales bacterium]|nr:ThiF family adenylyltransferase [Candidatus Saccharimonadales bacterium]
MDINYEILDRNTGLISKEEQEKIAGKKVLIAGCGLGSLIAVAAVRLGFHHFVLVDADTVDVSNLNRQEYSSEDIGKKKVDALADRLKTINRHVVIETRPVFVETKNADTLVGNCDIVVDTIDPFESALAVVALHRAARDKGVMVVYPIDSGWGGGAFVFSRESTSIENMLGYSSPEPIEQYTEENLRERFLAYYLGIIPEYFGSVMSDLQTGKISHIPQPISAAYIATAISVTALKRVATEQPIKLAPDMIKFDPYLEQAT